MHGVSLKLSLIEIPDGSKNSYGSANTARLQFRLKTRLVCAYAYAYNGKGWTRWWTVHRINMNTIIWLELPTF